MAKKMGTNPLKGLDGLIRNTQSVQDEPHAQNTHAAPVIQNAQAAQHVLHSPDAQYVHDVYNSQLAPNTQQVYDVSVVRDTHDDYAAQDVHERPRTQGRKGQKLPRINMAFAPEALEYLQAMAGLERVSITHYVNRLVFDDMDKRSALYSELNKLRERKQDGK